jgi:ferredoxin-type protein NapH
VSALRRHRYRVARRLVQLGTLALLWAGANAGVQVLVGDLSSSELLGTVPLSDPLAVLQILATGHLPGTTALVGAGIVLAGWFLVGGRGFCAWACPTNMVTDMAGWTRRRLRLKGRRLKIDRSARFWILGLALLLSALLGVSAFEQLSPIGVVQRELIFGPGLALLTVVVGLFVLDLFVLRQGWCVSLCPLGAFWSLVGHRSPLRVTFDDSRCDRCGDCVPVCSQSHVIEFETMARRGFIDSGDCLNCGRCIEVCPRDACHFGLRLSRPAAEQPGEST